jgi:hypothetical protein
MIVHITCCLPSWEYIGLLGIKDIAFYIIVGVSDNNLESYCITHKEKSAYSYKYVLCQGWKIVGNDTILSTKPVWRRGRIPPPSTCES